MRFCGDAVSASLAPKGRHNTAQGRKPWGIPRDRQPALKGRNQRRADVALSGLGSGLARFPGLTPWALRCRPCRAFGRPAPHPCPPVKPIVTAERFWDPAELGSIHCLLVRRHSALGTNIHEGVEPMNIGLASLGGRAASVTTLLL